MEQENLAAARKRVKANEGAPGISTKPRSVGISGQGAPITNPQSTQPRHPGWQARLIQRFALSLAFGCLELILACSRRTRSKPLARISAISSGVMRFIFLHNVRGAPTGAVEGRLK